MPNFDQHTTIDSSTIDEIKVVNGYTFYADPFFGLNGPTLRLEAMNAKTGLGDILEIDLLNRDKQHLCLTGDHYSHPFSFVDNGKEYLLPEVASHSPQYFIDLTDKLLSKKILKGLEDKRIVDATLFEYGDYVYLFFWRR